MTPLMIAAENGHKKVLDVILSNMSTREKEREREREKQTDVNTQNKIGWSALMYSVRNSYLQVVSELLKQGADVSLINQEGETVLDIAYFYASPPIIELIKKHVSANQIRGYHVTHYTSLELLVTFTFTLTNPRRAKKNLFIAVYDTSCADQVELATHLITVHIPISGKVASFVSIHGHNAGLLHSKKSCAQVYFYKVGADLSKPSGVTQVLTEDAFNKWANSMITIALEINNQVCGSKSTDWTGNCVVDIQWISTNEDKIAPTGTIEPNKNMRISSFLGHSFAVRRQRDRQLIDYFVGSGKSYTITATSVHHLTVGTPDENDMTPLMIAAENGHKGIANELLDMNNTVNYQNNAGDTALMYAAMNGRDAIITLLIDRGADFTLTNKKNATALSLSLAHEKHTVVSLLRRRQHHLHFTQKLFPQIHSQ